jgi:hypothetical protein
MGLIKVNINSFLFFVLCICLATFSINYEIVTSLRVLDIFFVILFFLFLLTNPPVNKILLIVFIFIAFIFFTSNMVGIFLYGSPELERLVFIYKYFFIFTLPWMVVVIVRTDEQIKIINKLLLINFIFLSSWTYIYLALLASGSIVGSFRPSFPFSTDYTVSDAHLYSSYLGFFLITYILYLKNYFNHNFIISFLIIVNGLAGLILTGSRTGLVMLILGFFLFILYSFISLLFKNKKSLLQRKTIIYSVASLILISFAIILMAPYISIFFINYTDLIERAFNLELSTDMSSQARIQQFFIGLKDSENTGLFLGLGLLSSLTWYDGIISILIAHGGLLFIFSIYIFYYLIIKKAAINTINQKDFLLFLLLTILYLAANIVTEYIFITRNAFPVLVMLSILFINIFNKRKGITLS